MGVKDSDTMKKYMKEPLRRGYDYTNLSVLTVCDSDAEMAKVKNIS